MADAALADPTAPDDPQEARRQAACAQRWIAELGISEKAQSKWLERAKKIAKLYKRENSQEDGKRRFAMLWANTETIKPAIYARPPHPVVVRRFEDADPIARICSEVLERALSASIDLQDVDGRLRECRDDFVLFGRGQTWERYVPTHGPQVVPQVELQVVTEGHGDGDDGEAQYQDETGAIIPAEQVQRREDGSAYMAGEPYSPVIYEESITDYVNWDDFGHSVARTWNEVWYCWRRVYLGREQLIERFGPIGKLVPLDWGPVQQGQRDTDAALTKKAAIYEIWDRSTKKVYWISKGWSSRPLDERDDPLGLEGFFPCPRPLLATVANDSVIPTPDYVYYQDQAEEIDKLTGRISELQDAVKVRGFYAATEKTNLNTLFNSSNNTLIPVPDWMRIKEGGGARGMVEYWPIDLVVNALNALIAQRQQMISDVYQITGVSDILRGMNDPSATATAERIKGAWGTLRIRTKQVEMMRFARDALRIKAEVIAEKFDPETLKAVTGMDLPTNAEKAQIQAQIAQGAQAWQMQVQQARMMGQQPPPQPPIPDEMQERLASPSWEDVVGLLRDNAGRQFRVDVETDSTIEMDEQEEKQNVVELTSALGGFIQQWGPAVQQNPALAPLAGALVKYAVRRFRAGRDLEATIDQVMDAMAKQPPPSAQGSAPAPPPDPTPLQVAQTKLQTEQIKQQGETQRAVIDAHTQAGDQQIAAQSNQLKLIAFPRDPQPQVQA
jgi:hypothetical protein